MLIFGIFIVIISISGVMVRVLAEVSG